MGSIGAGGISLHKFPQQGGLDWVHMGAGNQAERSILAAEMDDAPVSNSRHRQAGNGRKRSLLVKRATEQCARLR